MAAVGCQPLARAIYAFRVAVEGIDAPQDVADLMLAVDWAVAAEKPRDAINRRFTKLNQARPGIFRRLSGWLKQKAVEDAARRHGAYWAWMVWRKAAYLMHRGAKAHAAFGMDRGGRPPLQGFSLAEEAAIYALYLVDAGQVPDENEGLQTAIALYQARENDTRNALPLARAIGAVGRLEAVKLSAVKRGEQPKMPKRGVTP